MEYKLKDKKSYNMHLIKTNRFKTITVRVILRNKIKKEEIALRNVLTDMLVYSTYNYNTRSSLVAKAEDLYAASIYARTYRTGIYSNISFFLSILNEKYTEEGMLEESIKLLSEVLFNPNVKNGKFDEETLNIIKKNNLVQINSEKDNPARYSINRMLEVMGKEEVYSIKDIGYKEDLENITTSSLQKYYKEIMAKSDVDVYVIGNFDFEEMENLLDRYMLFNTFKKKKDIIIPEHKKFSKKSKIVREQEDFNQSKLSIGCKIENLTKRERNYVLTLYNLILGSGAESRFFKNIREKHSICYYISSSINKLDNILIIKSGIQKTNFEKCVKLIKKEMKDIAKGNITDSEIEKACQVYCTLMDEIYDSENAIIETYLAMDLLGLDDIEKRKEEIMKVTKEEIMKVANKIHMDTIYLLEGVLENGEN